MKKLCGFMLVVLSLMSCALLSACGNKYNKLTMNFCDVTGEQISAVEFLIDKSGGNNDLPKKTISVEFGGIKSNEIGQVVIYAEDGLVEVNNYRYSGNKCTVDVTANRSSDKNAKLIATHLASGKKISVPLNIEQKSASANINQNLTYIVSIPEEDTSTAETESNTHYVDLTKLVSLNPAGSTDDVFFKVASGTVAGVTPVNVKDVARYKDYDIDILDEVFAGFNVLSSVEQNSSLTIYPVAYLNGYADNNFETYADKTITIKFVKTLNSSNVILTAPEVKDFEEPIKLMVNHSTLKSMVITPKLKVESGVTGVDPTYQDLSTYFQYKNLNYFDLYSINAEEQDVQIVYVDENRYSNNFIVTADAQSDEIQEIKFILSPKSDKFVGDISPVELTAKFEVVSKADDIRVEKNAEDVSSLDYVEIFDYYEAGNALGARFNFVPTANTASNVDNNLSKTHLIVDKDILSTKNTGAPEYTYALEFYLFGSPLTFTENADGDMVSQEFVSSSDIHIKYITISGKYQRKSLTLQVETINSYNPSIAYWGTETVTASRMVNFNLISGVYAMSLQAGTYTYGTMATYSTLETENPEYVYINKNEIVAGSKQVHYLYVKDGSVLDMFGAELNNISFKVEISPIGQTNSSLKIANGITLDADNNIINNATTSFKYEYSKSSVGDVIALMVESNTQVGQYEVKIYQENILKAKISVVVYDTILELTEKDIDLNLTGKKAFKNVDYTATIEADYIVASQQALNLNVNLNDNVLNSKLNLNGTSKFSIIKGYDFNLELTSNGTTYALTSGETSDYYGKIVDNNKVNMQFKKGTYIDDGNKYITLTIDVLLQRFENIITLASEPEKVSYTINFFVYDEITYSDLTMQTTANLYANELLSAYYQNQSKLILNLEMASDLWNYVTVLESWSVNNEDGVAMYAEADTHSSISVFYGIAGFETYSRVITVRFEQFYNVFELDCTVRVDKPMVSEKVQVESDVSVTNEDQNYYINLKAGETYKLEANNYSSLGEVTNKGIYIAIMDEAGTQKNTTDYFEINQLEQTIRVKKVDNNHYFKLVVFALDALKEKINYSHNLANPSYYLLDGPIENPNLYKRAYFMADLVLSDGTENNPFILETANDFWEIDDNSNALEAHYELRTNINLLGTTNTTTNGSTNANNRAIENFLGSIRTYKNNVYKIDGIILEDNFKNLFTNFNGRMSNLQFIANCNYQTAENEDYLGVIDVNNGTLTNVSVVIDGKNVTLNTSAMNVSTTHVYFGGLVGKNLGTIEYTDDHNNLIGTQGTITLSSNTNVSFGGLVGVNFGAIIGAEQNGEAVDNNIVFTSSMKRSNAMSTISITANFEGSNSSVGGVVGLNSYVTTPEEKIGTIKNAFVQANIVAETTSNVGGVIGKNVYAIQSMKRSASGSTNIDTTVLANLWERENIIKNVKSASVVVGYNNVGGITGYDTNGVYLDCDFQNLNNKPSSAIVGQDNVGGIAGYSKYGKFIYCSVMSYAWDYSKWADDNISELNLSVPDIYGNNNVGGMVGYSESSNAYNIGLTCEDRTVIEYCSVNAYVKAEGTAGGVFTSYVNPISDYYNTYRSVVTNTYFIGKLEGEFNYWQDPDDVNCLMCLTNDGNTMVADIVYSINLEIGSTNRLVMGGSKNNSSWDIKEIPLPSYWAENLNLNGGYIFVTKDETATENSIPIFDIAPEKIEVTVKGETNESLKKTLRLNYYDFSVDTNATQEQIDVLNKQFNTKQLLKNHQAESPLQINVAPSGLGTVVLKAQSTNTQVVEISIDGTLTIKGIGNCELIFTSILNSEIEARINVIVTYPLGTFFVGTNPTSLNTVVAENSTQQIAKGSVKQYYVLTNATKEARVNGEVDNYQHSTRTNTNLKLEITYSENVAGFDISNYIRVSGIKTTAEMLTNSNRTLTVNLNERTPFMLEVLQKLETGYFNVAITPYDEVNGVKIYQKANDETTLNESEADVQKLTFKLETKAGVSGVSFSYDEAIVYLNDTVTLNLQFTTDIELLDKDTLQDAINGFLTKHVGDGKELIFPTFNGVTIILTSTDLNLKEILNITIENSYYVEDLNKHYITLTLEFNNINFSEKVNGRIDLERDLDFRIEINDSNIGSKASENCEYTILSQRINKIDIKNYYYDESEQKLYNVLMPETDGLMIIDMVPNNAYFSYLEISDITGNEEILFIEVDKEGNALSVNNDPSSDRKGIKLYGESSADGRLYVKTQISREYSSKEHIVEVRAYTNEGKLLTSNRIVIDVKMLPEVKIEYIMPNGQIGKTSTSYGSSNADQYLANGASATVAITSKNLTQDIEYKITKTEDMSCDYELVSLGGIHYELKRTDAEINVSDIGQSVTLQVTGYAYIDESSYETATCSLTFTLTNFVVHGVSVNQSIDNANTTEIYGYFDKSIDLEFYFDKDDISFYDETALSNGNSALWDTVYRYDASLGDVGSTRSQINNILKGLNTTSGGKNAYLILNENKKDSTSNDYDPQYDQGVPISSTNKIELINNKLTVVEGYKGDPEVEKYLAVVFNLRREDGAIEKWDIATTDADYKIDKNYRLNFRGATSWYEPTVINNEDDFNAMESGGRYILNADLVLQDYTPIDADLVEFDGNGHKITIKSFALFEDQNIQAGLFSKVYENMIVKNVVVEYLSTKEVTGNYSLGSTDPSSESIVYADLCNNEAVAYTKAQFGGITAVNNGIITNCEVQGQIAVEASKLSSSSSAGGQYSIDFYMGGMVAENTSTGYITNSVSKLSIFALANVGGFAYSNAGKISTSAVDGDVTLYGYNKKLGNTVVAEMAGFVVQNTNEISMSYVNLKENTEQKATSVVNVGTMSAKDISAGFVYSNSGSIVDTYVQMGSTGVNNNTFSGFVYSNSGSINRAYSFINNGILANKNDSMFAPLGTIGITNSLEFVNSASAVVEGLTSLNSSHRFNKTYYLNNGFAFGDNGAVWGINSGKLPHLVATQELVRNSSGLLDITSQTINVDGVDETTYKVNFANYGTKENPYIITDVNSWKEYFSEDKNLLLNGYYRIVKDIDFSAEGNNPSTSTSVFSGNIQGNNMILSGIMLYSQDKLTSIGLFEKLEGLNDATLDNAVRNLTLQITSVKASSTNAVGVLAGIVEDFDLYNLAIDVSLATDENKIIVGKNAVGGLAGIVKGDCSLDQISSNAGANSTRATTQSNYSVYMSKNNNHTNSNLSNVYYAGSVTGILDLYAGGTYIVSDPRNIQNKYFKVQNITVSGNIAIVGDTVGSAFGFVGETVYVNRIKVDVTGSLIGAQYSGGVAGENRGVINNASVNLGDMFAMAKNVASGLVGFNLGGLVQNVEVEAIIKNKDYGFTASGIVGRNVYGTIAKAKFDGELFADITGGIVGADYNASTILNMFTGPGAVSSENKQNQNLFPAQHVQYKNGNQEIAKYSNVSLSFETLNNMLEISNQYYSYQLKAGEGTPGLTDVIIKGKVLGLVVGLSENLDIINNEEGENTHKIAWSNVEEGEITFNYLSMGTYTNHAEFKGEEKDIILLKATNPENNVVVDFENVNVLTMNLEVAKVMFLIGAKANSFDAWSTYSNIYVLVK